MKKQKFIAMVKSFSNEIINDAENHNIPDFWDECGNNNVTDKMLALRPEGKKDLYGLCSPAKEGEDSFEYGIGVIIDDETAYFDADDMISIGFRIWDVNPATYVVFNCIGDGADCISEAWEKFYKEFLPQMGYEAEDETDYEIYYQNGSSDLFCELWIPVKKK